MLGQGNLPSRGALSACPGHPSRRDSFLPCKRFVPGHSASRGEKTVIFSVIFQGKLGELHVKAGYVLTLLAG